MYITLGTLTEGRVECEIDNTVLFFQHTVNEQGLPLLVTANCLML